MCMCARVCVFSRSHSSALVFVCNRFVHVIKYLCMSSMCEGIKRVGGGVEDKPEAKSMSVSPWAESNKLH